MVFVVRTDLNMPKGKIAAQVGHGVQYYFQNLMARQASARTFGGEVTNEAEKAWFTDNRHTKIGLKVNSEQELLDLESRAKEKGINTYLVVDNGTTMFAGVETNTVLVFAPAWESDHQGLTDHLKLL